MRKRIFAVVVVSAALAAATDIGIRLAGAMRQVGALASADADFAVSVAESDRARAVTRAAAAPLPTPRVAAEPLAPASDSAASFDATAALREAERDPNVAELLDEADPAVAGALRDVIAALTAPDAR